MLICIGIRGNVREEMLTGKCPWGNAHGGINRRGNVHDGIRRGNAQAVLGGEEMFLGL